LKNLKLYTYNQKVVYDKCKEHANGHSLSEYDWNSGIKKMLLDSVIKSSLLESVIDSIIEREETFEYNSHRLSRSELYVRVAYICEKYTMKSTLPIEGELLSH